MKSSQLILIVLAGIAFAGCNPPQTAGGSDVIKKGGSPSVEPPKPKEPSAELKNAAYDLLGFGRKEPYTYSFVRMQGVEPVEGDQTTELIESTDKAAKYQVVRTGGLEELGTEDFEVRKDGVYSTQMSLGKLEKPMLVMPADVSVGREWAGGFTSTDAANRKVTFNVTNKAVKEEKITVKAGEYTAILVTTKGAIEITEKGKTGKGTVDTKTWYAKGVGQLKMVLDLKKPDGTNVKSSVELVKIGKSKS